MDLLAQPLAGAEFLAIDVETNGCAGEDCELTEVGAVLVGGGELHERFESLVAARAPLSRSIQRFTGISQAMLEAAPEPRDVLSELARRTEGRVLVAHNAAFDRRVLAAAFERAGLEWPQAPWLCTVALARRFAPLARRRALGPLADALGIEVEGAHRALVDAEACARVFCALFPRLCAHAATVGDAVAMFARRRRGRGRAAARLPRGGAPVPAAPLDFSSLPDGPGVYVFRDAAGRALYAGKSVSLRSRARSHFAPGAEAAAWTAHAAVVDHRSTASELGALVLESRTIRELRPPGNVALKRRDAYVYVRCRLDVAYPVLEVASEPAAGPAFNVGPLRGQGAARELVDHLTSLFALRRCGRRMPRRQHPSAYGQMGRCLSPCLGDLDPNLYRRHLDAALALFAGEEDGRDAVLAHVEREMRAAAAERRYERAATLRRRRDRLAVLLERLGGRTRATHVRPQLVLAGPPGAGASPGTRLDAFWLVNGRVADWGPAPGLDDLERRTALALGSRPSIGNANFVAPDAVAELRIVATYLAAHEDTPVLHLEPPPSRDRLARFAAAATGAAPAPRPGGSPLVRSGAASPV
jgi:DNA polymerase-3 subunit epsilon